MISKIIRIKSFWQAGRTISGLFAEQLPEDLALGYAGAIIEKGKSSRVTKIEALRAAGVFVANTPDQLPDFSNESEETKN